AAMAEKGVVHRPGMAGEMMQELAPLLAAEGIDLENPDEDVDLDTLNAALARATEQYNLELFTPTGRHRDQVLEVLEEFSAALGRKRGERQAEAVLDSIEPEPTTRRPAASHVIGASLGLLDTWYTDAGLTQSLGHVTIPKWRGPARSTARSLLTAARRGQAYASLDTLIMRHGGKFVMDSAVLAAAATVLAYAEIHRMDVSQAAKALYEHTSTAAPTPSSPATGAAFGLGVAADNRHQELLAEFRTWAVGATDPSPELEAQISLLETLMDLAAREGLDAGNAGDTSYLIDLLLDAGNPEAVDAALQVLHDYVHFQLDTSNATAQWEATHEDIEIALDESNPASQILNDAMRATEALPESERCAALGQTRLVTAVPDLLAWVGKSQQISSSGRLRRADIEHVAAMIGVSAVGVAKRPLPELSPLDSTLEKTTPSEPETIYARSSTDVPMLSAWWEALRAAGVTELTATRVRPGPQCEGFTGDAPPPLEPAETLAAVFVAELLTSELDGPGRYFGAPVLTLACSRLIQALAPGELEAAEDDSEWAHLLEFRVSMLMHNLERAGLVAEDADGGLIIPGPLRGSIAKGVLMTVEYMAGLEEDGSE